MDLYAVREKGLKRRYLVNCKVPTFDIEQRGGIHVITKL
jgi:hypothetical protein